MSRIAVTVWQECVSPVFDTAATLLFADDTSETERINVSLLSLNDRVQLLKEQGCGTVICGAISEQAMARLANAGLKIVPWVRGPISDVLEAYVKNTINKAAFALPGCGRNRGGGRGRCRCMDSLATVHYHHEKQTERTNP